MTGVVPPSIAAEVAAVAGRYRLALGGQRFRGRAGGRRGHGVGSSMEFLDFRDYTPGDDLRYVDWRGYARTEQLRVRLHQEEVSPFVDVLVDGSASLAATAAKEHAARVLLAALQRWAHREGATARLLQLGAGQVVAETLQFVATEALPELPAVPLRPGGVRVLVTDALWDGDPVPLLRRLIAGASRFFCLQLLDPWELQPTADGATTLLDCESGGRAEVQLDARTIADYCARLQRLIEGVRTTVVGQGGTCALVRAGDLSSMCARDLLPAGVLEPA